MTSLASRRLVLFDIDGTLLSAGRAARDSVLAALEAAYGWRGSGEKHDFSGKTAIVIGAASGIGEAIAAGFARHNARVVAFDIKEDASRNIAFLDITDGPAVEAAFAAVDEKHGGVDIAVCMPAVNVRKPILKYSEEELAFGDTR